MNFTGTRTAHQAPELALRGDTIVSNRGLLRVEEAAQWLGVGRTKAYQLVHRGTLPSVTIGRSRRVLVSALEAFVEQLVEDAGTE
jgi:excisionase family DNA binding protein